MRRLGRVVLALAVPLAIGSGLAMTPPAFADSGGCTWGSGGGTVMASPGGTVTANGAVFLCSSSGGGNPSYSWTTAGSTTAGDTPGITTSYNQSTIDNASFSPGAILPGSNGDAYMLGSSWGDVGTWADFQNSLTPCNDPDCGFGGSFGGGGPGSLQP